MPFFIERHKLRTFDIKVFQALLKVIEKSGKELSIDSIIPIEKELIHDARSKAAALFHYFKEHYSPKVKGGTIPKVVLEEVLENIDSNKEHIKDIIDYFTDQHLQTVKFFQINPTPLPDRGTFTSPELEWRDAWFNKQMDETGKRVFDCQNPVCGRKDLDPFSTNKQKIATLDHVTPKSFDKEKLTFDENNTQVLCLFCNQRKGNIEINYKDLSYESLCSIYGKELVDSNTKEIKKQISCFYNRKSINDERVFSIGLTFHDGKFKTIRKTQTFTEII